MLDQSSNDRELPCKAHRRVATTARCSDTPLLGATPAHGSHHIPDLLKSLRPHDHLCLIYDTKEEWREAVVPFIAIGLGRGEKCIYIMDTSTSEDIRRYLAQEGVDVAAAESAGQLVIFHHTEAYTRDGAFDPDAMITLLIQETKRALAQGYPALRVTGEMTWVYHGDIGMDKLLEYEAKLNRDLFPHYPYVAICQYDRNRFEPEVIKGVIMTHPLVIHGSHIYENLYYIPPEEFLSGTHAATEVDHWLQNLELYRSQRETLTAGEERYRGLFEQSHEAIGLIDVRGHALEVNQAWLDLFGYDRDELQRISADDVYVDPADREPFLRQLAANGFVKDEVRHKKKGGTIIICQRSAVAHKDAHGNVTAIQTLFQDVTEQRRAQRALRESEERYRALFEHSMDAIYVTAPEGTIADANQVWLDLFGFSREEMSHLNAVDVYVNQADRLDFLRRMAETGVVRDEVRLKRKDGREFDCERSVVAIRDDSGSLVRFHGVIRDITLAKKAERDAREYTGQIEAANARLKEMDSLKSIFLASMSHELRTPLNSIIGFTGVLLMGIAGPLNDEQRTQLTMVKESAHHLLDLINDILDISKIEANRVQLSLEEFEFAAAAREVRSSLEAAATAKGLQLRWDVPDGVFVFTDRRRAKQVLLNLVSNAVKFTERGSVTVAAAVHGESIKVRVVDTGPGIAAADMARLFQPFQQVSANLTRTHEGTGLGLYLSRKIADLLQSEIAAESEYGKGSEFTFTMPLRYREDG